LRKTRFSNLNSNPRNKRALTCLPPSLPTTTNLLLPCSILTKTNDILANPAPPSNERMIPWSGISLNERPKNDTTSNIIVSAPGPVYSNLLRTTGQYQFPISLWSCYTVCYARHGPHAEHPGLVGTGLRALETPSSANDYCSFSSPITNTTHIRSTPLILRTPIVLPENL
jgi:hypothetical protein